MEFDDKVKQRDKRKRCDNGRYDRSWRFEVGLAADTVNSANLAFSPKSKVCFNSAFLEQSKTRAVVGDEP